MITVTGVTKRYGQRTAVDDLTFEVAGGRVTGFVGPNGAGKSTTLGTMVGLTRPDRGRGPLRRRPLHRPGDPSPRRGIGARRPVHALRRTARDHVRAAAALSGIPVRRVDEVLAVVGLEIAARQRAGGFSLGMRQRLALATAPLGRPEGLLLDEGEHGRDRSHPVSYGVPCSVSPARAHLPHVGRAG
jgi:ABC-2 type transport system ATP-binding protein